MIHVYGLKDPITSEIRYVGRTSCLNRRYREHLNANKSAHSHKINWINKLKKLNLKPELVILATSNTIEEAIEKETLFIKSFKNLTNHPGKTGNAGFIPGCSRVETRKCIVAKSVKTGEEIEFTGIYSVPKPFNGDAISKCLNGHIKQHQGYYWKHKDELFYKGEIKSEKSPGYGFIRINPKTNEEAYYKKSTDAKGFSTSGIFRCAQGIFKHHKGFIWKFATKEEKIKYTGNSKKEALRRKNKPIIGVSILTQQTMYLEHAKEDPNFNYNGILRCCYGKQKSYKGYSWRFV